MTNKLLKQTIIYSIGEIVPKIIGFILLPIYTHYLSPKDYGILSYTNSVTMFLYVLSAFSLNSYVLRKYFDLTTEQEKKKLIGNIFLFIGGINLAILALAYVFLPSLISYFHVQIPWRPYFKLALFINFLDVFSIIPLITYRVQQKAFSFVSLNLSKVLIQLGLTYYFIVVEKKGLIGNYYGQLYPLIIYALIYWVVIFKQAKLNINWTQIKEGLRFAMPLLPGSIAYLALTFADRVILERWVAISELGIYNVAYLLTLSVNVIIASGYKAIEPQIFNRYKDADFPEFIKETQSFFLFVVYCTAMLVTLFSQEVFKIMTSTAFYQGYLLVPIIMVGVIMTGQNVIFGGILTAENNTKVIGSSTIIGAVINIVFNLIFIPYWGTIAAAISVAISFGAMNIVLYLKMVLPNKQIKSELYAIICFCLVIGFLFYVLKIKISLISIFIKIIVFAAFIGIMCLVYKINPTKMFRLFYRSKR